MDSPIDYKQLVQEWCNLYNIIDLIDEESEDSHIIPRMTIIKLLIKSGLDVNKVYYTQDSPLLASSNTALKEASLVQNFKLVKYFVEECNAFISADILTELQSCIIEQQSMGNDESSLKYKEIFEYLNSKLN